GRAALLLRPRLRPVQGAVRRRLAPHSRLHRRELQDPGRDGLSFTAETQRTQRFSLLSLHSLSLRVPREGFMTTPIEIPPPSPDDVLYEKRERYALITLNRPVVLNAMNWSIMRRLMGALAQAE